MKSNNDCPGPAPFRHTDPEPGVKQFTGICLALALVTLVCYWPATRHHFINLDDQQYIVGNFHVTQGLTWTGMAWAFGTDYASNWHPLTWISHMLDCSLFGLNPAGHHLMGLLFHVANTLLLFVLLKQTTGALWRSAFVAALFAWHPLHVESVAWASERKDVLSAFFWMLTLLAYSHYVRRPGRARYGLAWLLFALGLMCKPMLVTLPFVLLLMDFWPLQRAGPVARWVREKIPFLTLSLAASIVTYSAQKAGGAVQSLQNLALRWRIANAILAYGGYLSKTVWPANLSPIYPYPHLPWPVAETIVVAFLLTALSGLFLFLAKRHPYLPVGWFWFLGTLVPAIGFVQVGPQSMADRYMYLPSIGLFILLVWGLDDFVGSWKFKRPALASAGALALAGCVAITAFQLQFWRDGVSLFQRAVQLAPDNALAQNFLGKAFEEQDRSGEALDSYFESVRLDPHNPAGQFNLGTALLTCGRLDEAARHLALALQDSPGYGMAHNNMGVLLVKQGRWTEAGHHFVEAIRADPDNPRAYFNLGTVFLNLAKYDEAIEQFSKALRLQPDYVMARFNLALALVNAGRNSQAQPYLDEVLPQFAEAVHRDPTNAEYRFNFGLALLEQNKPSDAEEQFARALQLGRDDAATHYRLALALEQQRKSKEAIAQFRAALRLKSDFPEVLNRLAWILSSEPDPKLRDGDEAVKLARQACELTGNKRADCLSTLAAAYAETGRFPEAIATAQTARDAAAAAGEKDAVAEAGELLKMFQSGRPYRTPL